jgi:hypothetical protein
VGRSDLPPGISKKLALTNADIDRRAEALVDRIGHERRPVTVKNAADLSIEERRRYGFSADWAPRLRRP